MTDDDLKALFDALNEIRLSKFRNLNKLLEDVREFYKVNAPTVSLKDKTNICNYSTITRFLGYDRDNLRLDGGIASALIDFLKQSSFYTTRAISVFNKGQPEAKDALFYELRRFYTLAKKAPNETDITISNISKCLLGKYEIYRRPWMLDETQRDAYVIRTELTIFVSEDEKAVCVSEKQQYKNSALLAEFREQDFGYVFTFAENIFFLMKGEDVGAAKFYAIDRTHPHVPHDGVVQVQIQTIQGTMMGVSGRGPHPGFKFVGKRCSGEVELGIFDSSAISSEVLKLI